MESNTKLHKLFILLSKISPDKRPALIINRTKELLFCYKKDLTFSQYAEENGFIMDMRPNRGDILDFFSQLELIINQIILVKVFKDTKNIKKCEELLDFIDLFSKIKFLNSCNLVDNKLESLLICVKSVRNGFAHEWDLNKVIYKNQPILKTFGKFKTDTLFLFKELTNIFNGGEIDEADMIKKLKNKYLIKSK